MPDHECEPYNPVVRAISDGAGVCAVWTGVGSVRIAEPEKVPRTKRLSLRNAKWLSIFTSSACALIWLARGVYVYWDDPRIINFLAAWIPSVISVLLAFIPVHEMSTVKKWTWRASVMAIGFAWSAVLWHQQVIADKSSQAAQQRIVAQAIAESNKHSDQQIGAVRDDVQGVKNDVQGVKSDLESKIGDTISKSTSSLNESIGKVGKPEPPEKAKMVFSLWPFNGDRSPNLVNSLSPGKDGVFPVDITFRNTSGAAASNMDIWIEICSSCRFASEPAGFDKPAGTKDVVRHQMIPLLNPGVAFEKTAIKITLEDGKTSFQIGFRYSCQMCESLVKTQIATVYIAATPQQ